MLDDKEPARKLYQPSSAGARGRRAGFLDYVKLYVTLRDDPKVLELSDSSFRAYIIAMCWSGQHETDGILPSKMLPAKATTELRRAGLLDGDTIHNWSTRQLTHEDMEAQRRSGRERQAAYRARRNAVTDAVTDAPPFSREVEVEVKEEKEQRLKATTLSLRDDFERFYSMFPAARKGARRPVRTAFNKAIKRTDAALIIAAAESFRDDPNRSDEYTPGAAAWLNRDGWEEPPLPSRNGHIVDRAAEIARHAQELERQGL